jgi:hypothetical protein
LAAVVNDSPDATLNGLSVRLQYYSSTGQPGPVRSSVSTLGRAAAAVAAPRGPATALTAGYPPRFGLLPTQLGLNLPPGAAARNATTIAAAGGGRLLIGGTNNPSPPLSPPSGDAEVVRYLSNGHIDRTFAACVVPDLRGATLAAARQRLKHAGCHLRRVTSSRSPGQTMGGLATPSRGHRRAPGNAGQHRPETNRLARRRAGRPRRSARAV